MLNTKVVLAESGVAFGTSGARGLVEQFTPNVCAAFALAFVDSFKESFNVERLAIAIDNRPSSYAMAQACSGALEQQGITIEYYGVIPTPALAYCAMQQSIPCIMVTGSHIPFDRNGLKFYRPDGEISKADENAILASDIDFQSIENLPELIVSDLAEKQYIERYTSLFDSPVLADKHIGIYEHSSAGRELYYQIFEALGAKVMRLEPSDVFVPIDTEAVSEQDKQKAVAWSQEYGFDAIFSTDGDGDRPLIADEKGSWLRGDILGLLCAKALNIEALSVPVSSNTSIELSNAFKKVKRTRIGSPYVIAEFTQLDENYKSVAGFEANGGFLLGTDTQVSGKELKALPTRDAVLPAIMLFSQSKGESTISTMVEQVSIRFSASDRIKNFATEKSTALIEKYKDDACSLVQLLGFESSGVLNVDLTDGLRMTLSNQSTIHLRPSGNAPELRCYAESLSPKQAEQIVTKVLSRVIKL
ncbi:phosphomannomutase [Endozoicomonas sp. G2_1]|uniref:phosphomannomutase n=1 Tax=Endozoicomonas sp. G2_1 TaxID=2821091 RepID=UPI001FFE105A|nr:phosphomannomutase [Endozoicomonas sp. G2_1]